MMVVDDQRPAIGRIPPKCLDRGHDVQEPAQVGVNDMLQALYINGNSQVR